MQKSVISDFSVQYVPNVYTLKKYIVVNMEWIEDDVRSILETEIQPEESATESRLISPVQFLRYRELGIRGSIERSVRQSVDIRESVDAWPHRLRHKLYNGLRNKLYNDNWPFANNDNREPSVSNDVAEFIYRGLWMTWERNQNLHYLRGINSFEDYVHIRKMNDLIEKVASEVAYNGAAYIRIPAGIGLFTEVIIFGDVLGDMYNMPRVDEDVAEMTFELFEMKLPYQQSNKYKWLHSRHGTML